MLQSCPLLRYFRQGTIVSLQSFFQIYHLSTILSRRLPKVTRLVASFLPTIELKTYQSPSSFKNFSVPFRGVRHVLRLNENLQAQQSTDYVSIFPARESLSLPYWNSVEVHWYVWFRRAEQFLQIKKHIFLLQSTHEIDEKFQATIAEKALASLKKSKNNSVNTA